MYIQAASRTPQCRSHVYRLAMSAPLYVVEEPGEWMFAVYDDGVVVSVDYYEGFAEITFIW